jgi:hypothetical protein
MDEEPKISPGRGARLEREVNIFALHLGGFLEQMAGLEHDPRGQEHLVSLIIASDNYLRHLRMTGFPGLEAFWEQQLASFFSDPSRSEDG